MFERDLIQQEREKFGGNISIMTDKGSEMPPEAVDYQPQPISDYISNNKIPYIVDKLQLKNDFMIDNKIKVKALEVEDFVRSKATDENLRDSINSYETVLERMFKHLPEPLERMVRSGNALKVLDYLFEEVALDNRLSGETYLEQANERFKYARVEYLKQQLKEALKAI